MNYQFKKRYIQANVDLSAVALLTFKPSSSLLWEAILCIRMYLAAFLASTHHVPIAFPQDWQAKMPPVIIKCVLEDKTALSWESLS